MRVVSVVALSIVFALQVSAANQDRDSAIAAVRADEDRRVAAFAKASRAVVCIYADRLQSGGGSGVVIDPDGFGLTNFHVVAGFLESRRGFGGMSDGNLYRLKVVGIDPGGDIVMFKLEGKERFDFAPLGDSDSLHAGQRVAAMGNPFVLAEDYTPTITLGVISGLHRYQGGQGREGAMLEYADCIQVSTSINPGNSGGPLFDMEGRVIGINGRASFEERGRVNVGLGYAVTVNQIKRFLPGLRSGRMVEHGTLGATVTSAGGELIVSAVQSFSAAERAGLQLGDELLEVAGRPVRTPNDYNNAIAIMPANWPLAIKLRRNADIVNLQARLDRLPLPGMPVYVVDLDQNQAELKKILTAARARISTSAVEPLDAIVVNGRAIATNNDKVTQFSIRLSVSNVRDEPDANSDDQVPSELRREWRQLAAPLLAQSKIDPSWEFVGGDEVRGRIANVIERRRDTGPTIRWKFDVETAELLEVEFDAYKEAQSIRWTPEKSRRFNEFSWPAVWTRRIADSDEIRFEIDAIEAAGIESRLISEDPE